MDDIERLVRLRFGQIRQDKLREYISKHPEFNESLENAHKQYDAKLIESAQKIEGEELDEEETKELFELLDPVIGSIKKQFTLDALVDKASTAYSRNVDSLREEWREKYRKMNEEAKDEEFPIDFSEFDKEVEQLLDYARVNDILFARLADIARKKGIDKAMQDKNLYKVTRDILPTREAYMEYAKNGEKMLESAISSFGNAFSGLNEEEEGLGDFMSAIFTSVDVYINVLLEKSRAQEKEEMNKIYDSDGNKFRIFKK